MPADDRVANLSVSFPTRAAAVARITPPVPRLRAAAPPESLYPAGDGSFEFERTVSRLKEMQSDGYMALGHGSDA